MPIPCIHSQASYPKTSSLHVVKILQLKFAWTISSSPFNTHPINMNLHQMNFLDRKAKMFYIPEVNWQHLKKLKWIGKEWGNKLSEGNVNLISTRKYMHVYIKLYAQTNTSRLRVKFFNHFVLQRSMNRVHLLSSL